MLWFQYYKLFVGYGKHDKKINLPVESPNKTESSNENNDEEKDTCNCCCYSAVQRDLSGDCTIRNVTLKCVYRYILVAWKFFAQLVTVPLLFLQIFDTYSLLCFNPRWLGLR